MAIRGIVLDLDGTLLNSSGEISPKTKETLLEIKKQGVKIIIATGRTFLSGKRYYEELDLNTPFICYNGAKVVNNNGESLMEFPIEGGEFDGLIRLAHESDVHLNLYQDEIWYVENINRDETKYYMEISELIPVEIDFSKLSKKESLKALFIGEREGLIKLEEKIKEEYGERLHTTFSKTNFLEILRGDVNKGMAMEKVISLLGIEKDELISFGDGLNDMEMLMKSKVGVAMGNGFDELKKHAKFTTLSNDEEGIANFLERYLDLLGGGNENS